MSDSPLTHANMLANRLRSGCIRDGDTVKVFARDFDEAAALLADTRAATPEDVYGEIVADIREAAEASGWDGNTDLVKWVIAKITRAAPEGTSIGTGGSGLDIYRGAPADAPSDPAAASAPTRETGWLELLREYGRHADGCSAAHGDQYRCRCGWRDVLASLPTPPRDERPQTGWGNSRENYALHDELPRKGEREG